MLKGLKCTIIETLHLSVSLRSFRSENVARFVKSVLDADKEKAIILYNSLCENYPIFLTRDLNKAKYWIQTKAKETERFGLIASSGAKRLRSFGVWVQSKIEPKTWFLNDADDVRSSYFFEDTATEFDIQELELDWTNVCWDANLRFVDNRFEHYNFTGSRWMKIHKKENILYLKNAYRVLLTRARQGMVIFIPRRSDIDQTRCPSYYDGIYHNLKELGIKEL